MYLPRLPSDSKTRSPRLHTRSLTRFDRKIAVGFGALVLVLMSIVCIVGANVYQRTARANEDILVSALTGVLADSINRTSFSGRYHMRRLLEQIAADHSQLAFLYVVDPNGEVIAHSNPALNASIVPDHLSQHVREVGRGGNPGVHDSVVSGIRLKEVVMPYRAGYENKISGAIVVGISLNDVAAPAFRTWVVMVALIASLTALSLLATYLMSKRFAGPVKQLASILHGILEHTPMYIGVFRPDGMLEESSANYRALVDEEATVQNPLGKVFHEIHSAESGTSYVHEWNFLHEGEERTAIATTFPISHDDSGEVSLRCSIAVDITGQRRAEAALREHRDSLEAVVQQRTQALECANAELSRREQCASELGEMREALLGSMSFDEKMRRIAESALRLLDIEHCSLWLARPGDICQSGCYHAALDAPDHCCVSQEYCLHLVARGVSPTFTENPAHWRIPLDRYRLGRFAQSGLSREVVNNVQNDPSLLGSSRADGLDLVSYGAYRLSTSPGELAGVLAVVGRQPFCADDESVLEELSTTAAYVIQAKLTADDLELANKNLIQRERLATLGELTATVSHELRNPLGTIKASFFLLSKRLGINSDTKIAGALERAERGIQRCDIIIEALLDFTRETQLHRQATPIDTWLEDEIRFYDFPPEITVQSEIKSGLTANVDRQVLYQCLTNVLNNARDAIFEASASSSTETRRIVIGLDLEEGYLVLSVKDTGTGISAENMELIFKPLFSTKGFGTGLGLPIVRKLLNLHGGMIDIQSAEGEGTTVRMFVPYEPVTQDTEPVSMS